VTWDDYDLASIEAQVMLLGIYKSFEELEDNLTLEEMNLILKASQEQRESDHRFLAAINGVKLDEDGGSAADLFEEMQREVNLELASEQSGKSEEELDLEAFGIKFT